MIVYAPPRVGVCVYTFPSEKVCWCTKHGRVYKKRSFSPDIRQNDDSDPVLLGHQRGKLCYNYINIKGLISGKTGLRGRDCRFYL